MLDFILSIFRYIFLFLLYYFIFQLIKLMFRDLYKVDTGQKRKRNIAPVQYAENVNPDPIPGAEAGLFVQSSGDPALPVGTVFPLRSGDDLVIGRGRSNTIVVPDPFASIEHASIYGREGQYWLADKGSKNGTFLNGIRIDKPTVLTDGDIIGIGSLNLQFVRWAYEMEPGNGSRIS